MTREHSKKTEKEMNYGICLMRLLFVFLVVCFHFHANWDYYPPVYIFLREMTVPIFLLIAFYLGEPVITGRDGSKKLSRMKRLFIPYLFWGVAAWVFTYGMQHLLHIKDGASVSDLLWQLMLGCVEKVDPPLYFLWQVMLYTLVFFLLYKLINKYAASVMLLAVACVCLWIQYDGRATLFFKTFRYEIMYAIGRIYELVPYAIFGLAIAVFGVDALLKKRRTVSAVALTVIVPLCLYFRDEIFERPEQTLAFSGVSLFVVSPLLFLWLLILPFEKLPDFLKKPLKLISDHTLGIFAIHWPMGKIFDILYEKVTGTSYTLTECFVIFLISFAISYIIGKLPGRFPKMLVR